MTAGTEAIEQLRELPRSERLELLQELVIAEFKATLLMTEDEVLPYDESYLSLGFTSLRITEVKDRLESLLGCAISANVLFNSPTLERLMAHLTDQVLPELFAPSSVSQP